MAAMTAMDNSIRQINPGNMAPTGGRYSTPL